MTLISSFQLLIFLALLGASVSTPGYHHGGYGYDKREAAPGYYNHYGYGHHGYYGKREAMAQPILYLQSRFKSPYDYDII